MVKRMREEKGKQEIKRDNAHSEKTTIIITTKQFFMYNVTFKCGVMSCLMGLKTKKQTNEQRN